ncbi:MAG TPA: GNAT family N-acetyltransferase [Candidatus Eisenbacteria bacterium]|nr:GNAT family N-acetyltransferase [Candidatus Eisenbacteria bacterium]
MGRAPSARLLRAIEAMGIRTTQAHWNLVPPELAKRLKPRTAHVADAFLTALPGSDALRMNRVIGLGHLGKASEAVVDEIIRRYQDARVKRFSVLLGPGPQVDDVAGWLSSRGFAKKPGLMLLVREGRKSAPREKAPLKVQRATAVDLETILAIHAQCFGMPPSRRSWNMAAAASRHQEHYLAFAGSKAIGVGTLQIHGDLAWLGGGGTLRRWRRHGAHRALILARLRRAASRGCRWVWVETAAPVRGRPDGSRRNLLRAGFEQVFAKPLFVWERG